MGVYYNLFQNLFQPVLRLAEKTRSTRDDGQTSRLRRRWDVAQTPYQRLVATGMLAAEQQQRLQALYAQTNPLVLRQRIYDHIATLCMGAQVRPGVSQVGPEPSPAA